MKLEIDDTDLPARAAYQASCDARGVQPNWGRTGYQAQAERWRRIAGAVADPIEPPAPRSKPKRALRPVSPDLRDIAVPMTQAILIMMRLLDIPDDEMSRVTGHVKHFQRIGFPKGLHTGRGSPAVLNRDQLLQMVVGMTLHRAAIPPRTAIAAVESAWPHIGPQLIKHLSGDDFAPMVMAILSNGPGSTNVEVMDLDDATRLLGRDELRSVMFHRLDVLSDRLVKAVADVLAA